MPKLVEFEGPTNCKIYLVGEAPGETEEYEGRPFVGGAGRILDKLLIDSGIHRKECRIGNVMRVRPPANKFTYFYQNKNFAHPTPELIEGRRYLLDDIKRCNPNVVVAMGNEPLCAIFHHRGITDWRGSILWSKELNCKVIPTIHPAAIMRMWSYLPLALFDMKRIQEESMSKEWEYPKRNFLLAPTFEQTLEWLNRIIKNKTRVCFDIETTYTPIPRLTAIGFADSPTNAICIPFTFSKGTEVIAYWSTVEEELVILNKVKELLEDETIEKVAQNAQFDTTVLEVNPPGIIVKGLYLDTMCAFHTIYPELEKGLAVLCSIYTKQPYYKHLRESGSDEIFWEYNCLDTTVTLECAIQIEKELEEFGVKDFYYKYVHPLIPILKEMQIRGIKIDLAVHSKALEEYTKAADELQLKLNERVGRELNVMSPKQMREFLYIDEKLPPKFKRGKAKEKQAIGEELTIDDSTVDEESLMAIASQHPDRDYLRWVVEIRGYRKLIGTYLEGLMGDDGRARCSYLIGGDKDGVGGTETGRLSSRESIFGTGTNLQNIPKGVCRKMFVPDESQVFVEADLEQAEARVVAYLAEEERLIDLFAKGGDIHTQNAAWIFGKSLEKVSGPERELAKRLVHASNYGIGPRTFAYHAGIKEGEAKLLLAKYFDTFPKIKSWQLGIQAGLSKSRILTTPFGRKRIFFARWGDELFRTAYAFVPQSTVGDGLNFALIRFRAKCPGAPLLLQVHDSFAFECKTEELSWYINEVKDAFTLPILIKGRELTIPVKIKAGKNWDELEKV